jgi:hypothetical protein
VRGGGAGASLFATRQRREFTVRMRRDAETPVRAERGSWVTIPCPSRVRPNDRVYVLRPVSASSST